MNVPAATAEAACVPCYSGPAAMPKRSGPEERDFAIAAPKPTERVAVFHRVPVAADREIILRPYGCGGWSWHWIDVASGADISGNGPYLGGGLEFFPDPTGCVGLDGRWHWVRAEGHGTSGLFTLGVSWSAHW